MTTQKLKTYIGCSIAYTNLAHSRKPKSSTFQFRKSQCLDLLHQPQGRSVSPRQFLSLTNESCFGGCCHLHLTNHYLVANVGGNIHICINMYIFIYTQVMILFIGDSSDSKALPGTTNCTPPARQLHAKSLQRER